MTTATHHWGALELMLKHQNPANCCATRILMFEQVSNNYLQRVGGAERDRTVDPLLAKQVLSQLSYSPISQGFAASRYALLLCSRVNGARFAIHPRSILHERKMVGLGRFELPTSPLSGVRSSQLSYRPERTAFSSQPLAIS